MAHILPFLMISFLVLVLIIVNKNYGLPLKEGFTFFAIGFFGVLCGFAIVVFESNLTSYDTSLYGSVTDWLGFIATAITLVILVYNQVKYHKSVNLEYEFNKRNYLNTHKEMFFKGLEDVSNKVGCLSISKNDMDAVYYIIYHKNNYGLEQVNLKQNDFFNLSLYNLLKKLNDSLYDALDVNCENDSLYNIYISAFDIIRELKLNYNYEKIDLLSENPSLSINSYEIAPLFIGILEFGDLLYKNLLQSNQPLFITHHTKTIDKGLSIEHSIVLLYKTYKSHHLKNKIKIDIDYLENNCLYIACYFYVRYLMLTDNEELKNKISKFIFSQCSTGNNNVYELDICIFNIIKNEIHNLDYNLEDDKILNDFFEIIRKKKIEIELKK